MPSAIHYVIIGFDHFGFDILKELEQVYCRLQRKQKVLQYLFVTISVSSGLPTLDSILLFLLVSFSLCLHSMQHIVRLSASTQSNKWVLL